VVPDMAGSPEEDGMTWDWLIVGSGFGGSVSALRLAEKGYSVLVLEKGRRWASQEFPKTNWNLRRWLWIPALGCRGFFQMTFFRHLTALTGVGVGGGSLVYANTLPTPGDGFFDAPSWGHLADWQAELEPHYQTARGMLGATDYPHLTAPDRVLKSMAEQRGRGEHFHSTPVAVYFGEPNVKVPDPYFGGEGPDRAGCTNCGGCMTGCRFGAKNTLDTNYLWLAEGKGAEVRPDTKVTWIRPHKDGAEPYEVTAEERVGAFRKETRTFRAKNVILAGGVLGTVELLLRLKKHPDGLPGVSARAGDRVRTNSEVLIGITTQRRDLDMSEGVSITSIFHTDDQSFVEPTRFASGSGFFRTLATPHASGRNLFLRFSSVVHRVLNDPIGNLRAFLVPDWARRTCVLLYMRTHEGYIRLTSRRRLASLFGSGLRSARGQGPAPTAAIPEATELADEFADQVDGVVGSILTETLFGIPTTAHLLGGACMGQTIQEGVIDHRHRVFGFDGLYVIDGSSMSANPGVNPSLTITALAERAMSFIPDKSEVAKATAGP
jgi:cholesterol oxidase